MNEQLFAQHEVHQETLKMYQEEFLWLVHEGQIKAAIKIAMILIKIEDNN